MHVLIDLNFLALLFSLADNSKVQVQLFESFYLRILFGFREGTISESSSQTCDFIPFHCRSLLSSAGTTVSGESVAVVPSPKSTSYVTLVPWNI